MRQQGARPLKGSFVLLMRDFEVYQLKIDQRIVWRNRKGFFKRLACFSRFVLQTIGHAGKERGGSIYRLGFFNILIDGKCIIEAGLQTVSRSEQIISMADFGMFPNNTLKRRDSAGRISHLDLQLGPKEGSLSERGINSESFFQKRKCSRTLVF